MKATTGVAIVIWVVTLGVANCSTAFAQENRLGRLFYTPQERQTLDQKRGVAAPTSIAPQTVIVNGMVVRSGQAPILFIDGKETAGTGGGTSQQQLNQGVRLKTESGQTIAAKPGQIVDLANGRAMESYQLVPGAVENVLTEPAPPSDAPATAKPAQTNRTRSSSR